MSIGPTLPTGFLDAPFAHRGLHGPERPENSCAAVDAAVRDGFGVEIDLQPAADGTPMVFHDSDLHRLTGASGRVAEFSSADLGQLKLCGTDEQIPTLAEILEIVAGRVPLLIELKDQTGLLGPEPETLEPATARLLTAYDGPVAVMSFNPAMIAAIAEHAPGLSRGLTTCAFATADWPDLPRPRAQHLAAIAEADTLGTAFISHDRRDLTSPAVAAQRRAGRAVLCWTVCSPAEEAVARRHADQITFEAYRPEHAPGP